MYRNRNRRPTNIARQNGTNTTSHDHTLCGHDHDHTIAHEFFCHVPLAIFSLALSFVIAAIIKVLVGDQIAMFGSLFHACHYAHLLFAATGASITFFRFTYKVSLFGVLAGMVVPFVFCTFSDIILPTLGAQAVGIPIAMHLCIVHMHEIFTVSMFLLAGSIAGVCLMLGSKQTMREYAQKMHFFHIFVSALAALFYLVMNGIDDIVHVGGVLLVILVVSIVLPCIFSDCLVPMVLSRWYARRARRYQDNFAS